VNKDVCVCVVGVCVHTEALYAHSKRKRIIPLRMEPDFEPDGWLGPICLSHLYYDFSDCKDDKKFNDEMNKLLSELNRLNAKSTRKGLS